MRKDSTSAWGKDWNNKIHNFVTESGKRNIHGAEGKIIEAILIGLVQYCVGQCN